MYVTEIRYHFTEVGKMVAIFFLFRNKFITFAMKNKNTLFSFILGEDVTNMQAMLAVSTLMALLTTVVVCEIFWLVIPSIIWFFASIYGCYKHGMLEE